MPYRLFWYTTVDLLRVICFAAAVLAVVTAFGAVIKPLSGDAPLSAVQAIKYVGLSLIPMMQYALPFAAGFGATIVFHRMASENEIMAMSVVGMRYRSILAPVLAIGLALAILMAILVQSVIPRVYAVMGRVIAGDVTALFEHAVHQGTPVRFGDMEIWAESMRVQAEPSGSDATERIELTGMVAARMGPDGSIESDVSASGAVLDLYEREGIMLIRMAMDDAVSWEAAAGNLRGFPRLEPTHAIPVPLPERTEPMAMTGSELKAVDADPARYPAIASQYARLDDTLRQMRQREDMDRRLQADGEVTLPVADRTGHTWRIDAARLKGGVLRGGKHAPVRITEVDADGTAVRAFLPQRALLTLQDGGLDGRDRRLALTMEDVEVRDPPDAARPNQRAAVTIANLRPFGTDQNGEDAEPAALLEAAEAAAGRSKAVAASLRGIERSTRSLHGQVTSRLWRRWAMAVTAGLLPILGAILALNMRAAQPLAIYLVGFVPALLNLVLISGGGGFIRQGDPMSGLVVMWSGNVVLAAIAAVGWWRLARH
ncbi:MAG: LptF/LptG family permease [Phycisphaerales bacterium]|jgi:lipopolysaccharide export LptBFGC system permease protein LptF|nr:LptF/LptG family permease [Phycisphaerales bacterium]